MTHYPIRAAVLALPLALVIPLAPLAAAETAAPSADPVVAVVNGDQIFRSEVIAARGSLPAQYQGLPLPAVYALLVNSLVDLKLAAAEGRRQSLLDDEKVKAQMARIEDLVLQREVITRHIEKNMTEAVLQERYAKLVEATKGKEEVHARHILVETEAAAMEIIAELNKGADFAKLAEERSTGPSAANGGDLEYFSKEQMVPEFSTVAFSMKKGEISKAPLKTQFGWHVIKVEDRRTAKPPAVEEVSEQLRGELSQEIGQAYIKELRKGATIERFNPDGSPIAKPAAAETPEKKTDTATEKKK
jgi:peptidyl-prolyl cis-trans isomerase C